MIHRYYLEQTVHSAANRTEEADKVSVRIAALLAERTFVFSPAQYLSIHARLFSGIYKHAGKISDYNITKPEWVLDGDTVMHGGALDLRDITIPENGTFRTAREDGIPAPVLYADAQRRLPSTELYAIKNSKRTAFTARLIPYFAFSNRGKTDMLIWTMAR